MYSHRFMQIVRDALFSYLMRFPLVTFSQRIELSAPLLIELTEELYVMETQGMNGRRKDAEDNIEQVEHYRNHNPDDDIPHKACDIVCHKGKKD